MTSSLVGSEMCIRDRKYSPLLDSGRASCRSGCTHSWGRRGGCAKRLVPVSYTHLTLPTICSV
eukprot:2841430-Prorocentrum_lima.AAC.1